MSIGMPCDVCHYPDVALQDDGDPVAPLERLVCACCGARYSGARVSDGKLKLFGLRLHVTEETEPKWIAALDDSALVTMEAGQLRRMLREASHD